MLRETLNVNTGTDVEAVVSRLRDKCIGVHLSQLHSDALLSQTRAVLTSLVEQGKRIAAVGSQMEATRDLTGNGYSIRIIFREGVRRTFIQKLIDRLRGQ